MVNRLNASTKAPKTAKAIRATKTIQVPLRGVEWTALNELMTRSRQQQIGRKSDRLISLATVPVCKDFCELCPE